MLLVNVLLSYHNLLDDWQDEKNYPKHVMSMMLKKDYARISRKYPRQAEAVEAYMRKLNMLEHKRENVLFAILCAHLFHRRRKLFGNGAGR